MKTLSVIFIFLLFSKYTLMAQQPQQWVKIIKDFKDDLQAAVSFELDSSGNIYFPTFFRTKHSILYLLDKYGNTIHTKNFVSSNDYSNLPECVYDGKNILLCGVNDYMIPTANSACVMMVKLDTCGNLVWQKNYLDSLIGIAGFIHKFKEGYIAGFDYNASLTTYSVIIQFDNNGNIIKLRSYPQQFHGFMETPQGPVIWGETEMENPFDAQVRTWYSTIARLDTADLSLQWYHPHGNLEYRGSLGRSAVYNSDGSILLNTFIENTQGAIDRSEFMRKYDTAGNVLWTRATSDSFKLELAYKWVKLNDSVIFEAGDKADSPYRVKDEYLMIRLIDTAGNVLKTRTYTQFAKLSPTYIKMAPDGKFFLSGSIPINHIYYPILIKFRQDLEIDTFTNPGPTPNGICSNFNSDTVYMDSAVKIWLTINKPTNIALPFLESETEQYYNIYPNPVSSVLHIKTKSSEKTEYRLYNSTGALLQYGSFLGYENTIDVKNYNSGMYFLRFSNSKQQQTLKILKE